MPIFGTFIKAHDYRRGISKNRQEIKNSIWEPTIFTGGSKGKKSSDIENEFTLTGLKHRRRSS